LRSNRTQYLNAPVFEHLDRFAAEVVEKRYGELIVKLRVHHSPLEWMLRADALFFENLDALAVFVFTVPDKGLLENANTFDTVIFGDVSE